MRAFDVVAKSKIPQFVKEDYPAFKEFIEAYYEWMEINHVGKSDFSSIRDIDSTLDEYLQYFRNTLAQGLPDATSADYRTIIKHIRDLFKGKGTEKSIDFFFRALFDEEVDVFYPRNQMFVPSDSTWIRNRILKIDSGLFDHTLLIDKELTFQGGFFHVKDAFKFGSTTVLSITDIVGRIEYASEVSYGFNHFAIKKQVIGIKIIAPGTGFIPGTRYSLSNGVKFTVDATTRGPIAGIQVIDGGSAYNGTEEIFFTPNGILGQSQGTGAKATIGSVDGFGKITNVTLLNGGSLYDLPPGVFCDSTGTDAVLRAYGNFGGLKEISLIDGGYDVPGTSWQETIGDALIETIIGNVCELKGTFYDNTGFISSNYAYLQDADYYQYFSYVIKSGINVTQYSDLLKKVIHPAGMKLFGSFQVEEFVQMVQVLQEPEVLLKIFNLITDSKIVLKDSIIELLIESINPNVFRCNKTVDINKFRWFEISSNINRWKDTSIRLFCNDASINEKYEWFNGSQPDLELTLLSVITIPGFGKSIGNTRVGDTDLG